MATTFPTTFDDFDEDRDDADLVGPDIESHSAAINKLERESRYGGLWKDPWIPTGGLAETISRMQHNVGTVPMATGQVRMAAGIVLRAGVLITGIAFWSGATAASVPLNQWFALIKQSDRTVLRSTVDDTTTAWAANSEKRLALSSTYTPSVDTPIYLGAMVVATTPPSLMGFNLGVNQLANATPMIANISSAGHTTPPADGVAITGGSGNNVLAYGYVY